MKNQSLIVSTIVLSLVSTCAHAESWRTPVPAPPPPANMPPAQSPQFLSAAVAEFAWSQGRGIDQQVNTDYVSRTSVLIPDFMLKSGGGQNLNFDHPIFHDPYVAGWGATRGRIRDVKVINRYGARLDARFYAPKLPFIDPVTGKASSGPFPTVIFIPGYSGYFEDSASSHFAPHEGALEQIAEHGYIVLAVSPQGQGGSETFSPPSPYCDPNGAWKQSSEIGLHELGACAGQDGPDPLLVGANSTCYNKLAAFPFGISVAVVLQSHLDPKSALDVDRFYDSFRTRFVYAALDAATWLASSADPLRSQVDLTRLGVMGHSAGSDAAVVSANGDPKHRFKVAVAWDDTAAPPDTFGPTVPTLLVRTELLPAFGPYTYPPHDEYFGGYRVGQRFLRQHVASMMLTLRGSNHEEFNYVPYSLLDPLSLGPLTNTSSRGGLVTRYYSIAWLDRWLKGATTSLPRGDEAQQIADARRRLLARTFDDSADRTSSGQGTFDPVKYVNVPYRIAGERVADHLTFFLHSQLSFDGLTCLDWQQGCGVQ